MGARNRTDMAIKRAAREVRKLRDRAVTYRERLGTHPESAMRLVEIETLGLQVLAVLAAAEAARRTT